VQPHDPSEQVGEEPLSITQEGALGFHAPKLLQEGEGYDLRVGEPLERLVVALPVGVEEVVGVVEEAQHSTVRASSVRASRWVWSVRAICCSFARGDHDGPFLLPIHATCI
jgi:hypothetical protein